MLLPYTDITFLALIGAFTLAIPFAGISAYRNAVVKDHALCHSPYHGGANCLRVSFTGLYAWSVCIIMQGMPPESYDLCMFLAVAGICTASLVGDRLGQTKNRKEREQYSPATEIRAYMLYLPGILLPAAHRLYRQGMANLLSGSRYTEKTATMLFICLANVAAYILLFALPRGIHNSRNRRREQNGD